MEEKKQSMGITTLGYGLILGVVVIIFSLLLFVLDVDKQSSLNYLSYVFMLAGLVIFQINYRDKHLGGYISYGQSFMVGFLTSVYYGLIMAIFTYIFFVYVNPGAIEEIRNTAEQGMMERGMSDQEIDQGMKYAGMFMSPVAMVIWAILGGIVVGTILSLITAIFTKKENPDQIPAA